MHPLKICIENCNELISDERRRILSAEGRKFADGNIPPRSRWKVGSDYFDGVKREHEKLFWMDTYYRRKQRNKRKHDMSKGEITWDGLHKR